MIRVSKILLHRGAALWEPNDTKVIMKALKTIPVLRQVKKKSGFGPLIDTVIQVLESFIQMKK